MKTKPQTVTVISLWFHVASDWLLHNGNVKIESQCSQFLDSHNKAKTRMENAGRKSYYRQDKLNWNDLQKVTSISYQELKLSSLQFRAGHCLMSSFFKKLRLYLSYSTLLDLLSCPICRISNVPLRYTVKQHADEIGSSHRQWYLLHNLLRNVNLIKVNMFCQIGQSIYVKQLPWKFGTETTKLWLIENTE